MSDANYDPFRGFVGGKAAASTSAGGGGERKALGSKLKAIDWEAMGKSATKKALPPAAAASTGGGSNWVVFDAKKVAELSAAAKQSAKVAKAAPKLTEDDVEAWRAEHKITIVGDDCPAPITDFSELTMMSVSIQASFKQQGFKSPTPIQSQAWPILFSGRDMVGIAKTGSGKTLAFIIPVISHITAALKMKAGADNGDPLCLVLAPTRELAQQIEAETRKVLPLQLRCTCIYGGASKGPQIGELAKKPHIVVGTPGRVIDFLEIKRLALTSVSYLVLDEADRMLDMGFEPQVRQICTQIPPDRQTLMFSATWPEEIQKLASSFQKDFIRINVGSTELLANPDVKQHFRFVDPHAKVAELRAIMDRYRNRRMIVFARTKKATDQLESLLKGHGFNVMGIHGDKEQRQREYILDKFRRDPTMVLVATDVAARGLDVKNLEVVINYDFAMSVEDYVHRIGRTARAGAKGESYTLLTKKEDHMNAALLKELIALLEKAKQDVPAALRAWADESSYRRAPSAGFSGGPQRGGSGGPMMYRHSSRPTAELNRAAPARKSKSSFDPAPPQSLFGVPAPAASPPAFHTGEKRSGSSAADGGGDLAAKRKRV